MTVPSALLDGLAWLGGAALSTVVYWVVVVYGFDQFDRGYGQRNWFQLSVYLSLLFVVAGLAGYGAASLLRKAGASADVAFLAGVVFTLAVSGLSFLLGAIYPDRDMTAPGLAVALVLGALSAFIARRRAT